MQTKYLGWIVLLVGLAVLLTASFHSGGDFVRQWFLDLTEHREQELDAMREEAQSHYDGTIRPIQEASSVADGNQPMTPTPTFPAATAGSQSLNNAPLPTARPVNPTQDTHTASSAQPPSRPVIPNTDRPRF